jgi:hypothetical protein
MLVAAATEQALADRYGVGLSSVKRLLRGSAGWASMRLSSWRAKAMMASA